MKLLLWSDWKLFDTTAELLFFFFFSVNSFVKSNKNKNNEAMSYVSKINKENSNLYHLFLLVFDLYYYLRYDIIRLFSLVLYKLLPNNQILHETKVLLYKYEEFYFILLSSISNHVHLRTSRKIWMK